MLYHYMTCTVQSVELSLTILHLYAAMSYKMFILFYNVYLEEKKKHELFYLIHFNIFFT